MAQLYMTFHMERGPMTTVQKNNWWVIHREVQVAVNTMAQLYMVLWDTLILPASMSTVGNACHPKSRSLLNA
jgi:hypothetical protein